MRSPYRMGHIALNVTDLERSERFYREVLGMAPVWGRTGEIVFLELGNDDLALIQAPGPVTVPSTPEAQGVASEVMGFPSGQRLNHLGFRVGSRAEVDRLCGLLRQQGVTITAGPMEHEDGAYSFYLDDPDGNSVQILYDPAREGGG